MNSLATSRSAAPSTPQPQHGDDLGVPGLLVVALVLTTIMVAAISLLAFTGAAWALWLAVLAMLLTSAGLMASIGAMLRSSG